MKQSSSSSPQREPGREWWRWAVIGGAVAGVAAAFGYAGGWLAPARLV